jgi:hypothetical protein
MLRKRQQILPWEAEASNELIYGLAMMNEEGDHLNEGQASLDYFAI